MGTLCLPKQKALQVAALPWRLTDDGKVRVLLITSRTNGKWMLPKGWPMPAKTDAQAAEIEALEEAGVYGDISGQPIGSYRYLRLTGAVGIRSQALIYPLHVRGMLDDWDEREQRARKWFRLRKASNVVFEPDLARFLSDLAAARIRTFSSN